MTVQQERKKVHSQGAVSETQIHQRSEQWESLYRRDRMRYGKKPSVCAQMALPLLSYSERILELGCGHGRDALLLASQLPDAEVVAVDSSATAIGLCKAEARRSRIGNIHPVECEGPMWHGLQIEAFGAIFAHFFFHLFLSRERNDLLDSVSAFLAPKGILISSFLSVGDKKFGKGIEIEPATFVCYEDRPWHFIHFFLSDEIRDLYASSGLYVEQIEEFEEEEHICDKIERSRSWLVVARKV